MQPNADYTRKILHIDMDAFYASIEQRDFPELQGKPIAVGGDGRRGVVATASYEARKFGVRSAMSGFKAKQLCPHLVFVRPRFDVYYEVSRQVRAIFETYTDLIEPLSLDEAYLDVTENKKQEPIATYVAEQIRANIYEQTQLTCSAGISYCKFLAKIASDLNKPNGVAIIRPSQAEHFLEELPIKDFRGVGKVTAEKMRALGIHTGADLKKMSKLELAQRFGKIGRFYYHIVRGIDNRPVKPDRIRKSLGVERTFSEDLSTLEEVSAVLAPIIEKFYERLKRADNFGRTITLKFKTADFQTLTRSHSSSYYVTNKTEIQQIAQQLLQEHLPQLDKIRLIGITASNLQQQAILPGAGYQLKFDFDDPDTPTKAV